jgi:hypothetical protein
MKTCGSGGIALSFLMSALHGGAGKNHENSQFGIAALLAKILNQYLQDSSQRRYRLSQRRPIVSFVSRGLVRPQGADMEGWLGVYWMGSHANLTRGGSPASGLGRG